ncbi:type I-E CRISPR-associated protein Cas7/Cse4/CasC [Bifidobacterium sp. H6bp22N]|uniref:type I-E CRISPR-associated protein Cas7/Cse4/CasC n=1 Tax=Bifidobacterium polysaccharolyticum TaxID=2750967 RepID=UPI0028BE098B|nr:type I-E CRISPR-associated protein Cas7/Cse4/CasC [Bifidobacterium sp. H6bp22N]MDT7507776.1 type I-E CRISPR-associated protein Cas7/Cse4/CasC [Bifidobacterium sp. H6bp22N]
MFMDIYAVQNVPPSNINRDETGNPKTAQYGGVLRSRVSSQAWKRAMRETFKSLLDKKQLGVRTKNAVELIVKAMVDQRPESEDQAESYASLVLQATGVKVVASTRAGAASGKPVTQYLIFIGNTEIGRLANIALEWMDQGKDPAKAPDSAMKKEVSGVFHGEQAVDIAMFGRMLADAPDLNTDASAQVAHAISVDAIKPEYDYFTAADDFTEADNAGAAMIDSVGFNSSTLYRYATVNLDALQEQIGNVEATARVASVFVEAFIRSMPTGKQNSYANRTLPETCIVAFRDSQPINAVEAFERPVVAEHDQPISQVAGRRLVAELRRIQDAYDEQPVRAWAISTDLSTQDLAPVAESVGLKDLTSQVDAETMHVLGQQE